MLKPQAFGNAAAAIVVVVSFICWVVTVVAPNLAFGIASSWFHMINLDVVRLEGSSNFGEALVGFVTLGAATWVGAYVFATLYNKWAK